MNFSTDPPCDSTIDFHPLEVAGEQFLQGLRVDCLTEHRRTHNIAEEQDFENSDDDELRCITGPRSAAKNACPVALGTRVLGPAGLVFETGGC